MNRSLIYLVCAFLMWAGLPSLLAQDSDWPRTLSTGTGTVTIYPLQVDAMNDGVIQFRAALAYRETAGSEPVFGAGWFESRVTIDSSKRIVHPTDFKVTQTRFPAGTDSVQAELSAALAQESSSWNLDFSLDELEAGLEQAEAERMASGKLNTSPPRIVYRDHPALLVSMDGEPVLREIEDSPFKAVINTPYPLIHDGKNYYLNVARGAWYRSGKATGPYTFDSRPPAEITALVKADESGAADVEPAEPITAANAPEIVVSTEPAELLVTEGPAAFVPLVDDLLVLQNSDDDVFMHVGSQKFYIVLAGRWYQADALDGPWTYQPADQLPDAFANIPKSSNQSDSRVYVAGTEEAEDAVLDNYVPQTAAVARGEADIDVTYDGAPVYRPVDGTNLVYIENTGSTVLVSDGMYYLVEDGVWYIAPSPEGPWQVATQRPAQVDTILPTSPVHNVKYVRIYDTTPDVVYVGYTPGYTGSYVYHNTIVYGSGWYYQPWVSPYYYYPRYSTWGFNVSYNPWSGWGFGLSWGWGPFSVNYYTGGYWHHDHYWHHRHYSRWGPHGYRPRHHGRRGHDYRRYADTGHRDRRRGDDGYRDYGPGDRETGNRRPGNRNPGERGNRPIPQQRDDNLYSDLAQRARITETRANRPREAVDREQFASPGNKNGRSRVTPVSRSDLRLKAGVRDANYRATRDVLFASNNGKVNRKPVQAGSAPVRRETRVRSNDVSQAARQTKVTKSRIRPQPLPNKRDISRRDVTQNQSPNPGKRTMVSKPPVQSQAPRPAQAPRQVQAPAAVNRGSRGDHGMKQSGKGGPSRTAPVKSPAKRGKHKRD